MKGRRTAAMLCVLLGHALLVLVLLQELRRIDSRARATGEDHSPRLQWLDVLEDEGPEFELQPPRPGATSPELRPPALLAESLSELAGDAPSSGTGDTRGFVDWPKEGRDAAARVLAREAEAERIARLFAGPQGTWASLTKRQQSQFNHFRWKPGVEGLERDEKGNTIYHLPNGCVLVNFSFFGCPIGKKPPPYGDLFKDMRQYFDEQRLPETNEGNGTEPESIRPPRWSKPLP